MRIGGGAHCGVRRELEVARDGLEMRQSTAAAGDVRVEDDSDGKRTGPSRSNPMTKTK